jgi:hypothetical protein
LPIALATHRHPANPTPPLWVTRNQPNPTSSTGCYGQALATLSKEDQASWHRSVASSGPRIVRQLGPQDLENYIENNLLRKYSDRRIELEHHELIKEQSFGEALDPDALEALARYEVHLDRKMGKTLTMLFKLKELSSGIDPE